MVQYNVLSDIFKNGWRGHGWTVGPTPRILPRGVNWWKRVDDCYLVIAKPDSYKSYGYAERTGYWILAIISDTGEILLKNNDRYKIGHFAAYWLEEQFEELILGNDYEYEELT